MAATILGERIVIYRTESGKIAALEDRCGHRLAPLSLGRCEGERLRCMYHGLLFNTDGEVVEIPGQPMIPRHARVRTYPVVDRYSWIWIWMGAGEADESLIPPAVGLDDPNYLMFSDQLEYESEAELICNNLLDFSHLTYVHANSFGAGDTWAQDRPRITPLDRGVRVERWTLAQPGIPGQPGWETPRDRFIGYDFLVPGILLMATAAYPVGTAEACGFGTPELAKAEAAANWTNQAVTPVCKGKARYLFSAGPHIGHGNEASRDRFHQVTLVAFAEDKVMIEAQQRVIDATPPHRVMPTSADKAITLYSAAVARLARYEGEAEAASPDTVLSPDAVVGARV
jgi:vanillate O-demethylase monooxygenase subunit